MTRQQRWRVYPVHGGYRIHDTMRGFPLTAGWFRLTTGKDQRGEWWRYELMATPERHDYDGSVP